MPPIPDICNVLGLKENQYVLQNPFLEIEQPCGHSFLFDQMVLRIPGFDLCLGFHPRSLGLLIGGLIGAFGNQKGLLGCCVFFGPLGLVSL